MERCDEPFPTRARMLGGMKASHANDRAAPRARPRPAREKSRAEDPHELDPALEFLRALWSLEHALERTSVRMETVLGLTAPQRFVIRILGKLETITPGELAGMLHVDPGSVTALVKRLEARGLLARRKDPNDGRRMCLVLTAKGKKLDVPTPISVERAVNDVLASTTASDLAAVRRVLGRLVTRLDEVSESVDALER